MKLVVSLLLMVVFALASACASNPPPAEPRPEERRAESTTPRREAPPPSRTTELQVSDVLESVLPEPVQAGKNIVIPLDADDGKKAGPLTCVGACRRIIGDCLLETLLATGKFPRQQIDKFRKTGMLDKIRKSATKSCQRSCAKPGTKNHQRIQAMMPCARKTSCAAVGACAAKHLK